MVSERVGDYVQILRLDFECSNECFVIAMVYMDRVIKRHARLTLGSLTYHRLLAASLTLAAKFHDDDVFADVRYAEASGVAQSELNALQRAMLHLLQHRLFVHPAEFEVYRQLLRMAACGQQDAYCRPS